ncbi:ALP1-like protein [Tanacetum coccineum]
MDPNKSYEERNKFEEVDDETTIWFMMQAYEYNQCLQEELNQPRLTCNSIYCERDDAEARLMRDYFIDGFRTDATGQLSFSSIMKCTSAIRQLAYDTAPDAFDEYLQMGEHTARDCLDFFNICIIDLSMSKYLRKQTLTDIENVYARHEYVHGFSGILGSIDCMHYEWKIVQYHGRGNTVVVIVIVRIGVVIVLVEGIVVGFVVDFEIKRLAFVVVVIDDVEKLAKLLHT